jgi:hypothetical protein
MLTATLTQSAHPTAFDWAILAAIEAGWMPPEEAFIATLLMLASCLDAREIERRFDDCRKRIQ